MENLRNALLTRLQDIFSDVKMSNHLVDEGKEVLASRQLQGARDKLVYVIKNIVNEIPEDIPFEVQNVATKNTKE